MIQKIHYAIPDSYKRKDCRLCFSQNLQLLFSLAHTPPAEWYFSGKARVATSATFPLDLYMCDICKHVQLLDVVDPQALFSQYFYESKTSPGLIAHFAEYAQQMMDMSLVSVGDLVVDIGSNDGTLLENFKSFGLKVVGVEPSQLLSKVCNEKGLTTYNSFLNDQVASRILEEYGLVSLITANNVFAHNDNLSEMAKCISKMLKDGGFFVFEVSSLLHTMTNKVLDYIYHEHLSYHSLIALEPFLERFSLRLIDVELVTTKGGSYRIYAEKSRTPVSKSRRLERSIAYELENGLDNVNFYRKIYMEVKEQKRKIQSYLLSLKKEKSMIVGYGASATTTTLIYEFELTNVIDYLVDDNYIRHGKFLPGTDIMVHSPDRLREAKPTHLIVFAWRFSQMILEKIVDIIPKETVVIVPLPEFKILNKGG